MPERKIEKATIFLFIDPAGGTDYSNVVCLENFSFSRSVATVDASTICGPDSSPGDITGSVNMAGQTFLEPDSGKISAPDLFDLIENKETFSWKISPAVPVNGDMIKTGNGYFSSYQEDYNFSDNGKFSATISIAGNVTQTIEGES